MLFMIGLEIDLKKIVRAGKVILFAAGGQLLGGCLLGILFFAGIGLAIGGGKFDALYLCVACALSSTVIIVKVLYEKRELDTLPGRKLQYAGWQELFDSLKTMLAAYRDIAMQYSPNNIVFTVSLVDGGTIELLRGLGKNVVSSADLAALRQKVGWYFWCCRRVRSARSIAASISDASAGRTSIALYDALRRFGT